MLLQSKVLLFSNFFHTNLLSFFFNSKRHKISFKVAARNFMKSRSRDGKGPINLRDIDLKIIASLLIITH